MFVVSSFGDGAWTNGGEEEEELNDLKMMKIWNTLSERILKTGGLLLQLK